MTLEDRLIEFFEDRMFAIYTIKNNLQYSGLATHSFFLSEPIPVYIGDSKKTNKDKRTKLKKAYQSLERKGTFKVIMEKWKR